MSNLPLETVEQIIERFPATHSVINVAMSEGKIVRGFSWTLCREHARSIVAEHKKIQEPTLVFSVDAKHHWCADCYIQFLRSGLVIRLPMGAPSILETL